MLVFGSIFNGHETGQSGDGGVAQACRGLFTFIYLAEAFIQSRVQARIKSKHSAELLRVRDFA